MPTTAPFHTRLATTSEAILCARVGKMIQLRSLIVAIHIAYFNCFKQKLKPNCVQVHVAINHMAVCCAHEVAS